jgi:type IV secretion system protein VirB10
MHQFLEAEVRSRPSALEFEMAYQARVAIDRIKFAIKHAEQFKKPCIHMREVGLQVSRSRIICPDASSVDLDGMMGLDSHGNSGLRDKVDRHYRRLIGFSVLTSMFTAAFQISQRSSQSALTYPTPAQTAGNAVGQELSQTGAQITRRNLNVQPTIKVPAGYKFTVRVNRDILFEAPYEPVQANPPRDGARSLSGKPRD